MKELYDAIHKAIQEESKRIVAEETAKAAAQIETRLKEVGGTIAARLARNLSIQRRNTPEEPLEVEYLIRLRMGR